MCTRRRVLHAAVTYTLVRSYSMCCKRSACMLHGEARTEGLKAQSVHLKSDACCPAVLDETQELEAIRRQIHAHPHVARGAVALQGAAAQREK